MADTYDGWELIGAPLGQGGQGTVHKARSPERVKQLRQSLRELEDQFRRLDNQFRQVNDDPPLLEDLAKHILHAGSPDPLEHLGAVKQFRIPSENPEEAAKAVGRLQSEVRALRELDHPGILKLLHANVDRYFIITEYHSHGTLVEHLDRYKGKALEALGEFRTLVRGISLIHKKGAIHRDIKPENIFVATDGHLMLGDFGIVFFADPQCTRLTDTYNELVGSHFWMAPWAYKPERLALEDVNASFDIFPLGKVLWSMVSGRNGFPYWEYQRPENNLETIFPDDPAMAGINRVLSKCVVREEEQCLHSADDLLLFVELIIAEMRQTGQKPAGDRPWLCRICGHGHYQKDKRLVNIAYEVRPSVPEGAIRFSMFICDSCRHTVFFQG
jgi:serine/threonine protein kinase